MTLPTEKQRQQFVKREATTNPAFGCPPEKRSVQQLLEFGIIDLNKPKGPTSHVVADYVKRILSVKTGHGGSLDPAVTGVLPMGTGKGTRMMQALLPAGKEYVCIMHLHDDIPQEQVRKAFEQFIGKISQLPPVKSAVKREVREREIYYLDILEIDGRDVLFKMGCQAGTYVRKVCHDVGLLLKTGAHMAELVRTKAGPFELASAVTLQDLEDALAFAKEGSEKFLRHCIRPGESAVAHLPKVWIQDNAVSSVCQGASLSIPGIVRLDGFKKGELVAIMTLKDELVALGEAVRSGVQVMQEEKGIAVKLSRVIMDPGVYPKS